MKTTTLKQPKELIIPTGTHKLLLHNDDFNDFQWVINCLIDVCKHSMEQAEQCAILTHDKGYCSIKVGSESELKDMMTALLIRQLSVTLEIN